MLNTLASTTADPAGYVELDVTPQTTPGTAQRRVNRVATLDGGAVLNDAGFSEADRTIELAWLPTRPEVEAAVERLLQLYSRLIVTVRGGVYLAAPEAYKPGGAAQSTLRLLVIAKLSA